MTSAADGADVTVIIPTHNSRRPLVLAAIDSVNRQTYGAWRAIVIDNGSTDGSAEAIEALGNPKVQVVRQNNLGPSEGRNAGISRTKTSWIAFLDSDDLWEPRFLETVMEAAHKNPDAALLAARSEYFQEKNFQGRHTPFQVTPEPIPGRNIAQRLLCEGNILHTSAIVCRTEAVIAVGCFDPGLGRSEDMDLWLRLALRFPCVHLPQVLARVRLHPGNTYVPEDKLENLRRRIYLCSKALTFIDQTNDHLLPFLEKRLRSSWRQRARILAKRGDWKGASHAYMRQWEVRPYDPVPLLRWTGCQLRQRFFPGNSNHSPAQESEKHPESAEHSTAAR